jgi:hypothetical protein
MACSLSLSPQTCRRPSRELHGRGECNCLSVNASNPMTTHREHSKRFTLSLPKTHSIQNFLKPTCFPVESSTPTAPRKTRLTNTATPSPTPENSAYLSSHSTPKTINMHLLNPTLLILLSTALIVSAKKGGSTCEKCDVNNAVRCGISEGQKTAVQCQNGCWTVL